MRSPFLASLAVVALALAPAAPAFAQPKKAPGKLDPKLGEAKRLFDEGAASYTQGNYEAAIDSWQKSYEISKKPLIFESIANAYERLGEAKKAREYLAKWREVAPKDEQDLLDARIKNLDSRVAHDDALEAQRKAEEEKAKKADEERERQRKAGGPSGGGTSIPGVILMGAGGAAVAVGVTLDVIASVRRPDPKTVCAASGTGQICKASAKDSISSSNTLATVGDVLWIAGGVAAAGGLVLVLTHKAPTAKDAGSATWVAPLGGGVSLTHTF